MVTVSAGGHHTVAKEPEVVTIKADARTALGVSFSSGGGVVKQVRYRQDGYRVHTHRREVV